MGRLKQQLNSTARVLLYKSMTQVRATSQSHVDMMSAWDDNGDYAIYNRDYILRTWDEDILHALGL